MVCDDEAQPRERYFRDDALTVNSTASLLETVASTRVVTMSQLAAMTTPRLDIRGRRAEAFNLVVGDTFTDRDRFAWRRLRRGMDRVDELPRPGSAAVDERG